MYLEKIHVKNLKLIDDLQIDFTRSDGSIRKWTILIGQNGRCKTAILQAIALAAAGAVHANDLGKTVAQSYPSRQNNTQGSAETDIKAVFRFEQPPRRARRDRQRRFPGASFPSDQIPRLESWLSLRAGINRFHAGSRYLDVYPPQQAPGPNQKPLDPLDDARAQGLPYWFCAAYGVSRHLRFSDGRPATPPSSTELHLERLRSVFSEDRPLRALGFADMFDKTKANLFARFVQALTTTADELLPELRNIELRGAGGVTRPEDFLERDRIFQALPGGRLHKLPATWLSHGYQSSLAWMTDLLGHALIEDPSFDTAHARTAVTPAELQGVVLIDELDLHLHPTWQRVFVDALKQTFPNLQFIATTHSPLLISALRPDEVVALELRDDHIVHVQHREDPRLLVGSEIYKNYFDINSLYAQDLGRMLDEYRFWARNPYRDDTKDKHMRALRQQLQDQGVSIDAEPVPRLQPPGATG
jgi:predicted ATPase